MACGVLPIAHRGASGVAPENTKIAFVRALDLGARAIELDVQLTRDDMIIVFHDDTLERTTDGTGRVAETDFKTIARLDAGSWFAPKYARAEVPTLDEVLSAFAPRAILNIELKADERVERLVKRVVTTVARFDAFATAVFSSFDPAALRLLRKLVPEARIGVLCVERTLNEAFLLAEELAAENLHLPRAVVEPATVARAHAAGRGVWAWTANEPVEIARLIDAGVDGIISDFPDRVRAVEAERALARTPQARGRQ